MKKKLMSLMLCVCMMAVLVTPYASVMTSSGSLPVSFAHADEPDQGTSAPSGTDTSATTGTDTSATTGTDTSATSGTDTSATTGTDTSATSGTDTSATTGTDTSATSDTDTSATTGTDTPVPAVTDTPVPAVTDTPVPAVTDTPVPAETDTPVPTDENTPAPTDENTTAPAGTDTPVPAVEATPVPSTGKALFVQEGKALPMQIEKVISSYLEDGYSSLESVAIGTASAQVPENGKLTLTGGSGVWQVEVEDGVWATIAGEDSAQLSVTAAFLKGLGGSARIRSGGLETRVSVTSAVEVPTEYETQIVGGEEAGQTPSASTGSALLDFLASLGSPLRGGASTYGASGSATTYTVVINYQFANGTEAASPYTATLAAGSSFSQAVASPAVLGYAPDQATVNISVTDIQENQTYTVTYLPAEVSYTVKHYQQNVSDDNYTLVATEPQTGFTENEVGEELAKTYDGFTALLYDDTTKIAADGSTVVEIYYDRNYYLMNFDLDDGYGVEPIYARYGAPISVAVPIKTGYTFAGWLLNGASVDKLPETMPAENRTYTALWTPDDTAKVTVVFWGENADDEEYSYIKSAEVQVKPDTEFTYSEDGTLICALETHTHNLEECYGLTCGQEAHTHSESCYTCGQTEHTTHSTACYDGVGKKQNPISDLPENPANGQVTDHWLRGKLIYINGSWYKYSGSTPDGSIAPTTCHTHTSSCIGCGKIEHTHRNECFTLTCGKTAHTHTSDCYMNGAGLDSNLWTFVKSDTVTVDANGSSVVNVYYDRTEKTLTFKYNYKYNDWNWDYQSTETITAKWGQDISTKYKAIAANAGSTFWSAEYSGDAPYTNYFAVMPTTSATYYHRDANGEEGTMTYYGQDLNGEYTVILYEMTKVGGYYVSDEDRYEFEGFTYDHGTNNHESCAGATFYYTRNSYTLTFSDGYDEVNKETVKYQAPLSTYSSYVPDVPSAYEAGSVTFDGWYQNPECTGEEYKLDEHTMPAGDVLLYAKWAPVDHTVRTWLTSDMTTPVNVGTTGTNVQTVAHRSTATEPDTPTNGSYTFVGWFYLENGVEKAFDFSMPVTKDLDLYAKWSSNTMMSYTIHYQLEDGTTIAADTTGSALAGTTKTFDAKGGTELYADYQEGYFPLTKSHSMTLDINATEEHDTNVFIFRYVQKDAVPYTVKYLNAATGQPVATQKTVSDNRKAVVTETFVPVSGMLPDAYQKRLVVSAEEGAVNEIIFYYTEDTTHAYYKITHYTENIAKDAQNNTTWTEYASSQVMGDIGETYSADPLTIPGFTYDSTVDGTVASGELTSSGLELKLYYTRNEYPYEFRFLEYATQPDGSHKELHVPVTGSARYGEQVTQTALTIPGYQLVAGSPENQAIVIDVEESTTATKNVKTFYYVEQTVDIHYVVVGDTGSGTLSNYQDSSVPVLNGSPAGSVPTAATNYRFDGWYTGTLNADGTVTLGAPVPAAWVDSTTNKLTPQKQGEVKNGETVVTPGMYVAATYYAKFVPDITTVTVKKQVSGNFADTTKAFTFQYRLSQDGAWVDATSLAHNGTFTIENVTIGSTLQIREKPEGYTPSVGSDQTTAGENHLTGASAADEQSVVWYTATVNGVQPNETITFTNNRTTTPDTGVLLDSLPYLLILAVVALGVVLMIVRRRRDDD